MSESMSEDHKNYLEEVAQTWAQQLVEMSVDERGFWEYSFGEEFSEEEWEWIQNNIAFYTDAVRRD